MEDDLSLMIKKHEEDILIIYNKAKISIENIQIHNISSSVLANIVIKKEHVKKKLSYIANINITKYNKIYIEPFDIKDLTNIKKHIINMSLNVDISDDEKRIVLECKPMTKEQRIKLVQQSKDICENSKINIRNLRRLYNNKIKKNVKNNISSDFKEHLLQSINKKTNLFINNIDAILEYKRKNLLNI